MADTPVSSVNPEPKPVADSAGTDQQWVDPLFTEIANETLPDELDPARAEEPSQEQLTELVEANPEAEAGAGEDHQAAEAEGAEEAPVGEETPATDGAAQPDVPDEAVGGAEEADAEDGEKSKPRRRSRARSERRQLEREVRDLQQEVAALKAGQPIAGEGPEAGDADGAEQAAEPPAAPTLEEFDYDTQLWSEALTKWTSDTINAGEEKQKRAEEAKQREAAEARVAETMQKFHDREDDARERYEDYDDAVYDPGFAINGIPAGLIAEAENGPDIAYYFATHPDETARLMEMSEVAQAREIGRLENRLKAEQAAAPSGSTEETQDTAEDTAEEAKAAEQARAATSPQPQLRSATQAPPVIPTVSGGAETTRDPSKMSMDEYAQGRRSGRIK